MVTRALFVERDLRSLIVGQKKHQGFAAEAKWVSKDPKDIGLGKRDIL